MLGHDAGPHSDLQTERTKVNQHVSKGIATTKAHLHQLGNVSVQYKIYPKGFQRYIRETKFLVSQGILAQKYSSKSRSEVIASKTNIYIPPEGSGGAISMISLKSFRNMLRKRKLDNNRINENIVYS